VTTKSYFFDHALLPSCWAADVRVDVASGAITTVTPNAPRDDAQRIAGLVVPACRTCIATPSSAAWRGSASGAGPAHDKLLDWRESDVSFSGSADTRRCRGNRGFRLHADARDRLHGGRRIPLSASRHRRAALRRPRRNGGANRGGGERNGIGLTLLPTLYIYGGFGGAAPNEGQKALLNGPERYAALLARSREIVRALPDARLGIAPHSLRAVTPDALRYVTETYRNNPIHIHAAEQTKEVEDSIAALGAPPVAWLLDNANVDARWCLIHATHMTESETRNLAKSGAVAGLCPLTKPRSATESSTAWSYLANNGRFGVGTDSNIQIGAVDELRLLEYAQRLKHRTRNVVAHEGESTGTTALCAGARRRCAGPRPRGRRDRGRPARRLCRARPRASGSLRGRRDGARRLRVRCRRGADQNRSSSAAKRLSPTDSTKLATGLRRATARRSSASRPDTAAQRSCAPRN